MEVRYSSRKDITLQLAFGAGHINLVLLNQGYSPCTSSSKLLCDMKWLGRPTAGWDTKAADPG
jgi:hypothetical protein